MVETDIPQTKICSPSAAFVLGQVTSNLSAFDTMESSSIIRSLFGVELTNPTAIDLTESIIKTLSETDQLKLRGILSDPGVHGVIWRFISSKKFMIEMSKALAVNGSGYTSLTLIVLNPAGDSVTVRELVRIDQNVTFLDRRTKSLEFNKGAVNTLEQAHSERMNELRKKYLDIDTREKEMDRKKIEDRIIFKGPEDLIAANKNTVLDFVLQHGGVIGPLHMRQLCTILKLDVQLTMEDNKLTFTFPDSTQPDSSFCEVYIFHLEVPGVNLTAEQKNAVVTHFEYYNRQFGGVLQKEDIDKYSKGLRKQLTEHNFHLVDSSNGNKDYALDSIDVVRDEPNEAKQINVWVKLHMTEIVTYKFKVQAFHDGTMKKEDLAKVTEYLEEHLFQNDNHEFKYDCAEHALQYAGLSAANWSIDHQEESIPGETIIKVKYDRTVVPKTGSYKFLSKSNEFGKDLECSSESIGNLIGLFPINALPPDMIDVANNALRVNEIKDYVVIEAKLDGSADLDDFKSPRTWVFTFDMTPEAKETERLHMEEEKNKIIIKKDGIVSIIRDAGEKSIKVFNDETREEIMHFESEGLVDDYNNGIRQFRAMGDITREVVDIIQSASWEFYNRFVSNVDLDKVIIKRGDAYYFRPNGRDENTNVDIVSYHTGEIVTSFCDPDVPGYKFSDDSYNPYVAKEDVTPKMLKEKSLSEIMELFYISKPADGEAIKPEKKETKVDDYVITVCDSLASCKDSIIDALKNVLSAITSKGGSLDESTVKAELCRVTEMDDLEVKQNEDGSWSVYQTPADALPPSAEVQSADIDDQNVQLNLLRGVFGVADPAITHVQKFLRNHLTEERNVGFLTTESFPTETVISWSEKPYDFTLSIVKMKDGRFYRIFLAYTNPGLTDQSWLATKDIPDRWRRIGRDIQNRTDFAPQFQRRGR